MDLFDLLFERKGVLQLRRFNIRTTSSMKFHVLKCGNCLKNVKSFEILFSIIRFAGRFTLTFCAITWIRKVQSFLLLHNDWSFTNLFTCWDSFVDDSWTCDSCLKNIKTFEYLFRTLFCCPRRFAMTFYGKRKIWKLWSFSFFNDNCNFIVILAIYLDLVTY